MSQSPAAQDGPFQVVGGREPIERASSQAGTVPQDPPTRLATAARHSAFRGAK